MSAATRYASRAELRERTDPTGTQTWSATEDTVHDAMLDAVSRAIDDAAGQFFFQTAEEARVFTAAWPDLLVVPPLVSVSAGGLQTDETGTGSYDRVWSTTDYLLHPANAASSETARPYYEIRVDRRRPSLGLVFPTTQRGVQVTGVWGWPAVPDPVREVCLLETQRLIQQSASPSGIVASPELGQWLVQPKLHPTSVLMLTPYIRTGVRTGHAA